MRVIGAESAAANLHRRAPIKKHLDDFELHLGMKTPKHQKLTMSRISKIVAGCGFVSIADMGEEAVEKFLVQMCSDKKYGPRTYNHYAQAIDSFANWLVSTKKLVANPLVGLERLNAEVDVRRQRRALSLDEIRRLPWQRFRRRRGAVGVPR